MYLAELFEEPTDCFDSAVEIRDVELLVRGVQIVVGEAEAHHDAGNLQNILEVGHNRNRPAAADEHRVLLECVMQRLRRSLDVLVVGAHDARGPFAPDFNLGLDSFWRELFQRQDISSGRRRGPDWAQAA